MKYDLKKISQLHNGFKILKERTITLTGELIKGVTIPAKKAKAGYWLGRLECTVAPMAEKISEKQFELIKEFGKEVVDKEGKATGNYELEPTKIKEYEKIWKDFLKEEEEISFCPFKFEYVDDLALPEEFWSAIVPFLAEPVEEGKK